MEKQPIVKPYNPNESKKEQVERMFDNIAPNYDLLNRVLSLGIDVWWRKKTIGYLAPSDPKVILDVATGTADVALMMAKKLQPHKIIGVDISNHMLDFGRVKIKDAGLSDMISLETGDSENLRFEDNTFDAVTVAFGVRNFENLTKGLAEMNRVLKPGGRVAILEFSMPRLFPFRQLYIAYFKYVLPLIGRLTSRDMRAYSYLFESVQAFPEGNQFLEKLVSTGYKDPKSERLTLGICSIYTAVK
jgi:demethylmenaquinone methyltransferase/2-methoxy-6-polyprenyl-1,4-benzoquinol methylase